MKINWTIKKKRGNHRPSLNYHIRLESFEKKLAVHAVRIQSLIPEIPKPYLSFCPPDENERDPSWEPVSFHMISVPFFKRGENREFIRLPFRASGEYPEVENSFRMLREEYEELVADVYGHGPLDICGGLTITRESRGTIAPAVAAQRLLGQYTN